MVFLLCCLALLGSAFCQPEIQGAITGLSTSIPCELGRQVPAPFWIINGTVHELFSIPQYFPSIPEVNSYTSLSIPFVTFLVDNVVFRCATFEQNGDLSPDDNAVRLVVQGTSLELVEQNITAILFSYQRLFVQMDIITLEWTFSNICNEEFELQAFMILNGQTVRSPAYDILVGSSNIAEIPSSQQFNNTLENLYYRLVAVWQNGTICSDRTSQDTYYRFEESAVLQTVTSTPRSPRICFDIPETTCRASLYFIWPQREEGFSCLCPVYNSGPGQSVFSDCLLGCSNTNIKPHLSEGKVCISDLNASNSEALFYFMCSTDPCTSSNCFVKTFVTSYRIVFSDEEILYVGLHNLTSIICDIDTGLGLPYWFLNDTLYTITTLLILYPSFSVNNVDNTLMIVVIPDIDNTVFQCARFGEIGLVLGTPTRIIIIDYTERGFNLEELTNRSIMFDFQELEMTPIGLRLGWNVSKTFVCPLFEVQRVDRSVVNSTEITGTAVIQTNLRHAAIPSSELLNLYYYRIVAVLGGTTSICSDDSSQRTLYEFQSPQLKLLYEEPNSLIRLRLPNVTTRDQCTEVQLAWDENCQCPVSDRDFFQSCLINPMNGCKPIGHPNLTENSVYLTDQNSSLNRTLFHFFYFCKPRQTNISIYTVVSSHKIIISEPPTEPSVNYNTSSLCFSTNSSIEVTFEYILSTDKQRIANQTTGRWCISDPFSGVCTEFNVTVIAINKIGNSSEASSNFNSSACREEPGMPNITYNDDSLCFSVESFTEVMLHYTITTAEKPNSPTMGVLRNLQCISQECNIHFNVTVVAINSAGEKSGFRSITCQDEHNIVHIVVGVLVAIVVAATVFGIILGICCYFTLRCPCKKCYNSQQTDKGCFKYFSKWKKSLSEDTVEMDTKTKKKESRDE